MTDNQSPEVFGQTPSQTVGPFFHYGLPWKGGADLVGDSDIGARPELFPPEHYILAGPTPKVGIVGEVITVEGVLYDADGAPVPDAMIEIWQADAQGRYANRAANSAFIGFGRASTSDEGLFRFRTVKPGAVPGPDGAMQAPHIAVGVFGRGLIKRLITRIYFEGEPGNLADSVLALVPAARRRTLMARRGGDVWRMDIVLQGDDETVFFDV